MWTSEKGNPENDDLSISYFARNRNATLKLEKKRVKFSFRVKCWSLSRNRTHKPFHPKYFKNGPLKPGYRGSMDGTWEFEPFFPLFVSVLIMSIKSTFCHGEKIASSPKSLKNINIQCSCIYRFNHYSLLQLSSMEDCEFPVLHDGFSPLEVILGTRLYSSDLDWDSH